MDEDVALDECTEPIVVQEKDDATPEPGQGGLWCSGTTWADAVKQGVLA
jgi:hypothetical protein